MKLLVGIPTHKRPDLLRQCLASIAAQEGDLPAVELFVADNDAAGQQGVAVVEEMAAGFRFPLGGAIVDAPGISAVRNAILDEARRRNVDFITMIDDDETASVEWLTHLLAMQRETSADVVGGPVQFRFVTTPEPSISNSKTFRAQTRPAGRTHSLWGSGNFLVTTRALERAGWPMFDHEFGLSGGEDRDWFIRVERLGLGFAWAPDALVTEEVPPERATQRWILQRAYRCGNCDMHLAMKNWLSRDMLGKLARITLTAGSVLVLAPVLIFPSRRLWLLRIWWRAAGEVSAIFGRRFHEYAERHTDGGSNEI